MSATTEPTSPAPAPPRTRRATRRLRGSDPHVGVAGAPARAAAAPTRPPSRRASRCVAAALPAAVLPALLALAACGGSGGPTRPGTDGPDPAPTPESGSVEVTTATAGAEPDPDGYTVVVEGDDQERPVGVKDTLVVADLEPGDHSVELTDLASNCGILELGNPRTVSVAEGDTASTHFAVTCEGRSALEVTTATVAGGLDGDGFRVAVDGGDPRSIGTDDAETFGALASGDHTVELSGLATGCTVDGPNPRQVTLPPDATGTTAFRVTCGLRDRIVYASFRDGSYDLWTMVTDGLDPRPLYASDGDERDPAVSADGSLVAFASETRPGSDQFDVWVVLADGSNARNLTPGDGTGGDPAVSPGGERIAFVTNDPDSEVHVMGIDGSSPRPLTLNEASDFDPAWSPDGSTVAFVSDRGGSQEIWVMPSDGSGTAEPVVETPASEFGPSWSPDGSRVAYRSHADGDSDILKACVNGATPPEGLTGGDASDSRPAWSPDGSTVAFTSFVEFRGDVWTVGSGGSGLVNLTDRAESDSDPAWSPQTSGFGPAPGPGPSAECQVASP